MQFGLILNTLVTSKKLVDYVPLPAARGRQPGPAQPRCVAVASHTDAHLRKSATASHRAHAHHAHRQSLAFRDWAAFLRPSAARGALQRRRPPAPPTASPFRH